MWLLACLGAAGEARSAVFHIPQEFAGIQIAINAAQSGDTVLVSRGTYAGGLAISGKTITLASNFIVTGDTADVSQTTIDGGSPILAIQATVGAATTVRGLTFRNGNYQLVNYARRVNILNNRFIDGSGDQLSFEAAGGLVQDCYFDNAGDDGIDSDNASDPTIVNNTILDSGNDGIEIRLHGYTGSNLDLGTTLLQNPLLDSNFDLLAASPCKDAGAASIVWNGIPVSAPFFSGAAPDLGAHESSSGSVAVAILPPPGLALAGVRPNPSWNGFTVAFSLPDASPARIELVDLAGRRILVRDLQYLGQGSHVMRFPESRTLPAGVYLVRLTHGGRSLTTRCVVIK